MPKEPKTAAEEKESVTADLVAKLAVAADAMRQYATLADSLAHIVAKNPDDAELTDAIQEALVTAKPTRKRKLPVAAAANANSEDATSKKRKREKKPKDPNAPKRPASAYLIFQNGIRAKLKADNPNLQQKDLLQMISLQWAQMSDEDKQPYYSQVAEAKEKFQMDKAAYDIRDVDGDSPVAELPAPSKPSKKPVKQASEEPAIKKTAKKVAAKAAPKSAPIVESDESSAEAEQESDAESGSEEEPPVKAVAASSEDSEDDESSGSEDAAPPPPKKKKAPGRS